MAVVAPMHYSNSAYSGGGGSGYILTDTSYKPSGYNPDTKYYMTHVNDGSIGSHDLNTWEQSFIDVDGNGLMVMKEMAMSELRI